MTKFESLLRSLQAEHDREVAELRGQIKQHIQQTVVDHEASAVPAKELWHKARKGVEGEKELCSSGKLKAVNQMINLRERLANARKAVDIHGVRMELRKSMGNMLGDDSLADGKRISFGSRLYYKVENMTSVYSHFFLSSLFLTSVLAIVALGVFWQHAADDDVREKHDITYFMFDMFQLIAVGGIDDTIRSSGKSIVFTLACLVGLLVFAVLVGIITENFQQLVASINKGKSQVVESNHTLLLGWNESTERVVCQLAFIRRQLILANSSWKRRLFWWTRVAPSTPVANARIVIMCADKTKEEMHDRISRAFAERGISPKRTRVGFDVICRVGDPTNPQDLWMMGAHRAAAIAVMMTSQDMEEEAQSGSSNGATFRALLAVRSVLFSDNVSPPWGDIRIVVPLTRPCKAIGSAAFSVNIEEHGVHREVVLVQDLSLFVNTLMMTCATQPGLSDVLMDLMSFDGDSLRLRRVKDFPDQNEFIGKTFQELALHWDNAILVGVAPLLAMHPDVPDPDNGMAPAGSRVITPDDRLIFVSTSSCPIASQNKDPPAEILLDRKTNKLVRQPTRLLSCGFRPEWRISHRFAKQMRETLCDLESGSSMHFLNLLEEEEFDSVMQSVLSDDDQHCFHACGERTWTYRGKVEISHTCGDAGTYTTLQALLIDKHFDCVIIVPPVDTDLSPQAQDTRLMTIMCTVRSICDENSIPPPHIIGENKLESTAQLAIRPRTDKGQIDDSDFVNVQAIIARALCQALAYPFMQPPLVQLLSAAEGTPSVHLCNAGFFLPFGEEIAFADVVRQVKKGHEDDICIGYRAFIGEERRLKTKLAPNMRDRLTFHDGDTLIIISRHDPDPLGGNVLNEPGSQGPGVSSQRSRKSQNHDMSPSGAAALQDSDSSDASLVEPLGPPTPEASIMRLLPTKGSDPSRQHSHPTNVLDVPAAADGDSNAKEKWIPKWIPAHSNPSRPLREPSVGVKSKKFRAKKRSSPPKTSLSPAVNEEFHC